MGLTLWILSVKLIIDNGTIIYKSGFYKKEVLISSITEIETNFKIERGKGQRDVIFNTNDLNQEPLRFNIKYFGKKDLTKFFEILISPKPNIVFDNSLKKEFANILK